MKRRSPAFAIIIMLSLNSTAQIGIGTDNPSAKAVLHLESSDKGLIIPKMNSAQMDAMTLSTNPDVGTLIFNTDNNEIWCWKGTHWYSLTPMQRRRASNISSQHITATDSAKGNPLEVRYLKSQDSITAPNATFTTVNATYVKGYGTTPVGGIIMWSGTTIPDGWALCNGQTSNGHPTPDLSGKFVVGYNSSVTDYNYPGNYSDHAKYKSDGGIAVPVYNVGKTGGSASVTLSANEIPAHTHEYKDRFAFEDQSVNFTYFLACLDGSVYKRFGTETLGGYCTNQSGMSGGDADNEEFLYYITNTESVGGSQAHENRPPYYVLAFIMRVK